MNDSKKITARCPVSFIKDKEVHDTDLNNIFMMPYDLSLVSSVTHGEIIDERRKELFEAKDKDELVAYGIDSAATVYSSFDNSIMSYLVMNITEIIRVTMLRFYANITSNIKQVSSKDDIVKFDESSLRYMTSTDEIRDFVVACLDNRIICTPEEQDIKQIYLKYDSIMDTVFSKAVALIFDRDIFRLFEDSYYIDKLFPALYLRCYSELPPSDDLSYIDKRTFIIAIAREIMQDELIKFRYALCSIAKSASLMESNVPTNVLPANFMNPKYTVKNMIEEHPDLNIIGLGYKEN